MVRAGECSERHAEAVRDRRERVAGAHDVRAARHRDGLGADGHAVLEHQRSERSRADDAVRHKMDLALVTPERAVGAHAQVSVERPVVHALLGEQELKHGDVETEQPGTQDSFAKQRTAERAERLSRPLVRDSRDGQVGAPLGGPDRCNRLGAYKPVDRPVVEAERPQRNLHAGVLRVGVGSGWRSEEERRDPNDEKHPKPHSRT